MLGMIEISSTICDNAVDKALQSIECRCKKLYESLLTDFCEKEFRTGLTKHKNKELPKGELIKKFHNEKGIYINLSPDEDKPWMYYSTWCGNKEIHEDYVNLLNIKSMCKKSNGTIWLADEGYALLFRYLP
jgi:hypothetical protein